MSKLVIALFFVFSISSLASQAQNPRGGMAPPEFDAEEAAGLISFDIDEVIKKLKVSETGDKRRVAEALSAYNVKVYELSVTHGATLQNLEAEFDENVKIAMQNRDRSRMNGVRERIKLIIPPIRKEVMAAENVLNQSMATILDDKQNKSWLKYQRRQNPLPAMSAGR